MWQKWAGKGVLFQQGAIPAVCAEVKAFEAPHEKCQNMQWISLNHKGLKSSQVILRGHSLPLPGRRNRTWCPVALALKRPHLLWQDSVTSLSRSVWLLERRGLTQSLLVLRAEVAMSLNRFEGRHQMLLVRVFTQVVLPQWINSLHQTMLAQREMINYYWGDPGNKWDRVCIVCTLLCLLPFPLGSQSCVSKHFWDSRGSEFYLLAKLSNVLARLPLPGILELSTSSPGPHYCCSLMYSEFCILICHQENCFKSDLVALF